MKFTEGYWLRKESIQASYASQAFVVENIPNGLRMICPERPILNRGGALDVPVITVEFTAAGKNNIKVRTYHFEAYDNKEPRFPINIINRNVVTVIGDEEATMTVDDITLRINRSNAEFVFEADGKILTGCGFRNLGYIRDNKQPASMRYGSRYLREDWDPYMVNELTIKPGETIYGFGEQFTAYAKNGQVVDMWNEDGGTASDVAYKNVPFYMSSEGYGVFVDSSAPVSFEVASEKVENVSFAVPGEEARYHVIYGKDLKDVLKNYTDMTGKPALPPAWSFGLWLSTSFTTIYDEKTTSSFIDGMAERNIPLRVFHFDCYWMKALHWCDFEWDGEVFSDVPQMLKKYHEEKGVKICVWINPYIAQGNDAFAEAAQNGYLLMREDGKGVRQTDHWNPGMGIVDFTNPDACKWYQGKLQQLLDVGVDCFKTDFGERIPTDVAYYNGANPEFMHNYYTYLYNKCVFDFLKEKKGEGEAVLFARSTTACGQQFPVHWGGDCSASYASMAETLRAGLSFAMSGFGFWSHDISGFENTAPPDIYKRWCQFGLLSSHSRLHGSTSYRVPWNFDEESCDVVRLFAEKKCEWMPYLYSQAVVAHEDGIPMMRPMELEFFGEMGMKYLDMQYMLGESLMVAPIFNENGTAEFYLPEGTWTHALSGEVKEGGKWYTEKYDYMSLPLFIRDNTIFAVHEGIKVPDYDYRKDTSFNIYALKDGATAKCFVTDVHGNNKVTVEAVRNGNTVTVTTSEKLEGAEFNLVSMDEEVTVVVK